MDHTTLDAIDVHVPIEADGHGRMSLPDAFLAASVKYFPLQFLRDGGLE